MTQNGENTNNHAFSLDLLSLVFYLFYRLCARFGHAVIKRPRKVLPRAFTIICVTFYRASAASTAALSSSLCRSRETMVPSGAMSIIQGIPEMP